MHFIIVLPLALNHVTGLRFQPPFLLGGRPAVQPGLIGFFFFLCHGTALVVHLQAEPCDALVTPELCTLKAEP